MNEFDQKAKGWDENPMHMDFDPGILLNILFSSYQRKNNRRIEKTAITFS
jgi:hypothetical protein